VTTSSESSRSVMRPEYLAEFEAAGVAPPSDLLLRDQVEPLPAPATHIQRSATRKVILMDPRISANVVVENIAVVAVGTLKLLLSVMMIAIGMYAAIIIGFMSASRKGNRRGL